MRPIRMALALAVMVSVCVTVFPPLPAAAQPGAASPAAAGSVPDAAPADVSAPGVQAVPGEILVQVAPSLAAADRSGILAAGGGTLIREIPELSMAVVRVPRGQEQAAVSRYRSQPGVQHVQPNQIFRTDDFTPNDTCYATTCPAHDTERPLSENVPYPEIQLAQWGLPKVQAPRAWDQIRTLTRTVKVAVLDTGVDPTHPDLAGQLVPGYDTISNDANPRDGYGHGTHVAGIVAAVSHNGAGVASLGGNVIKIMPVRVLDDTGAGTTDSVVRGIIWATDQGARVINMSLGGPYDQALDQAVYYAWNRGVVVVVSAGNNGYFLNTPGSPAISPFALAVGATDANDQRATFSTANVHNAVAAPGSNILSTLPTYTVSATDPTKPQHLNPNYDSMTGTSMAAPMASSLAAVLCAQSSTCNARPLETRDAILRRIQATADNVGGTAAGARSPELGWGRINAYNALNNIARPSTVGGVYGQAMAATGNPESSAAVTLTNTRNRALTYRTEALWSGHFRFDNVAPGTYTVTATTPSGANPRTQTVTVTAGSDTRLLLGPFSDRPSRYGTWWQFTNPEVPSSVVAGSSLTYRIIRVVNTGTATWLPDGPNRVGLNYRWRAADGRVVLTGQPVPFWPSLGAEYPFWDVVVQAPSVAGAYRLEFDLMEGSAWFSELDPAHAAALVRAVTVTGGTPVQTGLTVTPPSATLGTNDRLQLRATATYSDGTSRDMTGSATWASSNTAIATVGADGVITGRSAGSATVTARVGTFTASSAVTVRAGIISIRVTPSTASITPGSGIPLTAIVTYSDGRSVNVTNLAAWNSGNPAVASVSPAGYVTGRAPGTATISAAYGGFTATAAINVTCASGSGFDCPIALGSSANGSVNRGQSLYYSFYATRGTRYTITLTPGSGDPDLTVYSPTRAVIGSSSAGAGVADRVTFTASADGYHYVRVYGFSGATFTLSR